jgi:hypothetical protein
VRDNRRYKAEHECRCISLVGPRPGCVTDNRMHQATGNGIESHVSETVYCQYEDP